jgi:D-alanyl-D-alanine carboxypeptidase-like protein
VTNSLAGLRSNFRPWARDLVHVASVAGVLPRVTSTLRSYSYQSKLYRDFLAGRNAYPVAPPGHSAHELGLAFDMVTSPMSALAELGRVWEDWGGVWGGRFGDEVHFEFPGASQRASAPVVKEPTHPLLSIAKTVGQLAIPLPLMTKEVPCGQYLPPDSFRCKYFSSIFCCK